MTFVLKISLSKAFRRLKKRKKKNRYDKFSKAFYSKAQNAFIRIAKKNKKKYYIFDNSKDNKELEKEIARLVFKKINYKNARIR